VLLKRNLFSIVRFVFVQFFAKLFSLFWDEILLMILAAEMKIFKIIIHR
jgi:hypothetical protein